MTEKNDELEGEITLEAAIELVAAVATGDLTLAQIEETTAEELYAMADVGYDQMEMGELENARIIFAGLTASNPFDAYFHALLASACQRQADYPAAALHYRRAIDLEPDDAYSLVNLGEVLLHLFQLRLDEGDCIAAGSLFGEAETTLARAAVVQGFEAMPAANRARHLQGALPRLGKLLKGSIPLVSLKPA